MGAAADSPNDPPRQGSTVAGVAVAGLLLTIIASAAGLFVGSMIVPNSTPETASSLPSGVPAANGGDKEPPAHSSPSASPAHDSGEPAAPAAVEEEKPPAELKSLAPIVTNLAYPADTWIRLEASILLDSSGEEAVDVVGERVSQQILTFLHTVTLSQIEGDSGILHFRQDLNDLVRTVSQDRVREVFVHSMVVE